MPTLLRFLNKLPLQRLRMLRFVVSGGMSTALNFLILYVLTDFFGLWYLFSAIISIATGFVLSFILQKFWTFEHHSLEYLHTQFFMYVGVGVANMTVNALLLYGLVEYFHFWYIAAQVFCTILLATMNFFVYRHMIFVHTSE